MKLNIRLAYLLTVISELNFKEAVLFLYLLRFVGFTEVAAIIATLVATALLMDVPTGMFADRFGKKLSLFFAFVLYSAGLLCLVFFPYLAGFLIAALLLGLSDAFYSGSLEAMIYESLLPEGRNSHFSHVMANEKSLHFLAIFAASILGGYLYLIEPVLPFILMAGLYLIGCIGVTFLTEPKIDSENNDPIESLKESVRGIGLLFSTSTVRALIIPLLIISSVYFIAAQLMDESFLVAQKLTSIEIGYVFGIGALLAAFFSQVGRFVLSRFTIGVVVLAVSVILLLSFILSGVYGTAVIVFAVLIRGAIDPLLRNATSVFINSITASKNRVTVLSAFSLLMQLPFIFGFYFFGFVMEKFSIATLSQLLAGIALVPVLFLSSGFRKFATFSKVDDMGSSNVQHPSL